MGEFGPPEEVPPGTLFMLERANGDGGVGFDFGEGDAGPFAMVTLHLTGHYNGTMEETKLAVAMTADGAVRIGIALIDYARGANEAKRLWAERSRAAGG